MNTKWTKFAVVAVVLSISTSSRAQHTEMSMASAVFPNVQPDVDDIAPNTNTTAGVRATWSDVLSAPGVVPLKMKAGLIDSSWRSFKASNADWSDATANLYAGGSSAYFTQGLSLAIGNETFLVTYRAQRPNIDIRNYDAFMARGAFSKSSTLTRDTTLILSLLNTRTMGNLNEVKPFDTTTFQAVSAVDAAGKAELRAASYKNLRLLAVNVAQYAQENDELLPPMKNIAEFKNAIFGYAKQDESRFKQPGNEQPYQVNASLSNKSLARIQFPVQTATIYEATVDTDGKRVVAFVDGHVKRVNESEWQNIKKVSKIK